MHSGIRPIIIGGNHREFLTELYNRSATCLRKNITLEKTTIEPRKVLNLDPGGMMLISEPWARIEIDSIPFEVQPSKAEYIDYLIDLYKGKGTQIPGWSRFVMQIWGVAIPEDVCNELQNWLKRTASSSAAMNAQLEMEDYRENAEKNGHTIRVDKLGKKNEDSI